MAEYVIMRRKASANRRWTIYRKLPPQIDTHKKARLVMNYFWNFDRQMHQRRSQWDFRRVK